MRPYNQINIKIEKAARLRELATKSISAISDMPQGPSRDPKAREEILTKVMDLEREIEEDIDRLIDLKADMVEKVSELPDLKCQRVLLYRYSDMLSWDQIAAEFGFSVRYIHKLHGKAIAELATRVQ